MSAPLSARLLSLVAAGGGALDLDDLADRAFPAPKLTGTAAYRAWRTEYAAWEASRDARRARVSRAMGKLRERGWVTPGRGAPVVAEDVPDPMTAGWWRRRRAVLVELDPDAEDYAPGGGDTAPCETAIAIVARIRAGVSSVTEAVGESGCAWEVYAALVAADVVVPPGRARVTDGGVSRLREVGG